MPCRNARKPGRFSATPMPQAGHCVNQAGGQTSGDLHRGMEDIFQQCSGAQFNHRVLWQLNHDVPCCGVLSSLAPWRSPAVPVGPRWVSSNTKLTQGASAPALAPSITLPAFICLDSSEVVLSGVMQSCSSLHLRKYPSCPGALHTVQTPQEHLFVIMLHFCMPCEIYWLKDQIMATDICKLAGETSSANGLPLFLAYMNKGERKETEK